MMGFIEKLKLLFKVRQPATDLITELKDVKTGWKTVPFWVTVSGTLLSLIAAAQGVIPASMALIATTTLTFFYNILRGATKASVPGTKPIFQTTEFWTGVLGQLANAILALKGGGINPQWFATAETIIAAAMAAGQNLAGQQPNVPAQPQP